MKKVKDRITINFKRVELPFINKFINSKQEKIND